MKQICELSDKIILGQDGLSDKPPRLTARAIVKNQDGLYAVMYAEKWGLYSLPGGGIEEGEDALTALRREVYEETGCVCDEIRELGIVAENRASLDYTQINYYFVVTTTHTPGKNHLTESEQASRTVVQWNSFDEMVRLINGQEYERVQGKYLKARDVAALNEYAKWVELYIPKPDDLWFYRQMLSDPDTMSYNANWDVSYPGYHRDTGCIDYSEEELADWYEGWIGQEPDCFYAYIKRSSDGAFIGDVNFHYTPEKDWWDMGIVIYAPYRGKGYAVPALKRMLDHAFRDCGISRIHNDFEVARNEAAAWETHRKAGFKELGVKDGFLQMMITKEDYFNTKLEHLCDSFHIPVKLITIHDPDAPQIHAEEKDGVCVITMNSARIPTPEYASYAGYHVRKHLLPSLCLETERLILRRYRPEDAEQCFAFLSNEQDAYMDCSKAFTVMDAEYHERVALFGQRETQYMVTLKSSGEVIGTVNVFADNSRAVDAMEIGYCIAPLHQRKGYAFEALSALLDLLQKDLYLELVTAGTLPENTASQRLLEKLGFRKEGLRHKAIWHEGLDKPVDLIYYYRDRNGWKNGNI